LTVALLTTLIFPDDKKAKVDVKKDSKKPVEDDGEEEEEAEEEEEEEPEEEEKKPADKPAKVDVKKPTVAVTKNGSKPTEKEAEEDEDASPARTLGEITAIEANIASNKCETLTTLHTICYDNPGKTNTIKKNLRKFIGFEFDGDSDDYKKRLEATQKIDAAKLKQTCDILKLETTGTAEEMSERICKFLLKPEGDNEPEDEEPEDPEPEEEEPESEEVISEEEERPKKKAPAGRGRGDAKGGSGGRPKRATAARSFNRGENEINTI
jgi:hypothetical protein